MYQCCPIRVTVLYAGYYSGWLNQSLVLGTCLSLRRDRKLSTPASTLFVTFADDICQTPSISGSDRMSSAAQSYYCDQW